MHTNDKPSPTVQTVELRSGQANASAAAPSPTHACDASDPIRNILLL